MKNKYRTSERYKDDLKMFGDKLIETSEEDKEDTKRQILDINSANIIQHERKYPDCSKTVFSKCSNSPFIFSTSVFSSSISVSCFALLFFPVLFLLVVSSFSFLYHNNYPFNDDHFVWLFFLCADVISFESFCLCFEFARNRAELIKIC